jgi:seryl-tRNA synthetase
MTQLRETEMIDIRLIRGNESLIVKQLNTRMNAKSFEEDVSSISIAYRAWLGEINALEENKRRQNKLTVEIADVKKNDNSLKLERLMKEAEQIKKNILKSSNKEKQLKKIINEKLLDFPNLPDQSTPHGINSMSNKVISEWGEIEHNYSKPHYEIGKEFGILDLERGANLTGRGFIVLFKQGAKLIRAISNFLLDLHTEKHGYVRSSNSQHSKSNTMMGTGQIPKFDDEMYKVDDGKYLIPTAEVTLTNLHKGELLNWNELPKYYTAETRCYRKESGGYGADTKGMFRVHEFRKVELVKIVHPDNSYEELEKLTEDAENVLKELNLPFRRIEICTGDLCFAAAKTYDLEVFLPSQNAFREISSCSIVQTSKQDA